MARLRSRFEVGLQSHQTVDNLQEAVNGTVKEDCDCIHGAYGGFSDVPSHEIRDFQLTVSQTIVNHIYHTPLCVREGDCELDHFTVIGFWVGKVLQSRPFTGGHGELIINSTLISSANK
jgi:hypothetical protein